MPYTKKTNKNYFDKVEMYVGIAVHDLSFLLKNQNYVDYEGDMMFSPEAVDKYPECAKEDLELYTSIFSKVRLAILSKCIHEELLK